MNNAPLAYDVLWDKLRARFQSEAQNNAIACAKGREDMQIRRSQGKFEMCLEAVAIMDELKEYERSGGLASDEDDSALKH